MKVVTICESLISSISMEVDDTGLALVVFAGDLHNASFGMITLAWSSLPTYISDLHIVIYLRLVPC